MFSRTLYTALVIILASFTGFSQLKTEKSESIFGVSLVLGHASIPAAEYISGSTEYLVAPSWGLDFSYDITKNWTITSANEIILQEFVVNNKNVQNLTREYPFSSSIVFGYLFDFGLAIGTGPGLEFEKNHNFFIWKIEMEYYLPLGEKWFFKPIISYETKNGQYASYSVGFGVEYVFGNRTKEK